MTDSVAKLRKGSSNSKEKLRNGAKDETSESNASCSDMVEEYSTQWPDRPCHESGKSLLTTQSMLHNCQGLLTDCMLLLVFSNFNSVVDNLFKYGFVVNPLKWIHFLANKGGGSAAGLIAISWVFPLTMLLLEKAVTKGLMSQSVLLVCHIVTLLTELLLPVGVVFLSEIGPLGAFLNMALYATLFLKLYSYMQVNWWCRNSKRPAKPDKSLVHYPHNLNVQDMMYFLFAPTLCYELNFPRTKCIRKSFVLRQIVEAIFLVNIMLGICQQWLLPIAINSVEPFKDMEWGVMIQRVLMLALPNHVFWLIAFYLIFHSLMNLTAELLRFADRKFYGDWWNSDTIAYFWRSWNIPVHRFASRHIYKPLLSLGYSKITSQLVVFVCSAFFHEYLVSISFQMLRPWAFVMVLSNVPLILLTNLPFMRGQIGNIMVWTGLIFTQPVANLLYLHDYYWIHWAPLDNTKSVINVTDFLYGTWLANVNETHISTTTSTNALSGWMSRSGSN